MTRAELFLSGSRRPFSALSDRLAARAGYLAAANPFGSSTACRISGRFGSTCRHSAHSRLALSPAKPGSAREIVSTSAFLRTSSQQAACRRTCAESAGTDRNCERSSTGRRRTVAVSWTVCSGRCAGEKGWARGLGTMPEGGARDPAAHLMAQLCSRRVGATSHTFAMGFAAAPSKKEAGK